MVPNERKSNVSMGHASVGGRAVGDQERELADKKPPPSRLTIAKSDRQLAAELR